MPCNILLSINSGAVIFIPISFAFLSTAVANANSSSDTSFMASFAYLAALLGLKA